MTSNQNVGHGHVFPRPDGMKARCGGPAMCSECAKDLARKYASEVEASVPLSTYESAVKGRQDFRKAYVEARQLLKKFVDAWEGVPGHENMDRLCEIARNGQMPQDETSCSHPRSPMSICGRHLECPDCGALVVRPVETTECTARSLAEEAHTLGRQQPSKLHDAGSNPAGQAKRPGQPEPMDYTVQCRCGWIGKISALRSLPEYKMGCPKCSAEFVPFEKIAWPARQR